MSDYYNENKKKVLWEKAYWPVPIAVLKVDNKGDRAVGQSIRPNLLLGATSLVNKKDTKEICRLSGRQNMLSGRL